MRLRDGFIVCAMMTAFLTEFPVLAAPRPPSSSRPSKSARPKSSRDNVVRLAAILDDERTVAELKRDGALMSPQGAEVALLDAMRAYEALGDPEGAVDLLKKRSARYPQEKTPRIQLALLYERMGKSESSVPVWQGLDDKSGLTVEQTVQYARALSRLGRLSDALTVLQKHRPEAAKKATGPNAKEATAAATHEYWQDIAMLAWEQDDSAEALFAYRRVWAIDHRAHDAALRLMTLCAEIGARAEARTVRGLRTSLARRPVRPRYARRPPSLPRARIARR